MQFYFMRTTVEKIILLQHAKINPVKTLTFATHFFGIRLTTTITHAIIKKNMFSQFHMVVCHKTFILTQKTADNAHEILHCLSQCCQLNKTVDKSSNMACFHNKHRLHVNSGDLSVIILAGVIGRLCSFYYNIKPLLKKENFLTNILYTKLDRRLLCAYFAFCSKKEPLFLERVS